MRPLITWCLLWALASTVSAQSVAIGGGFSPNRLRGSHFNATYEHELPGKFALVGHYQMIKYTDIFQSSYTM